MPVWIQDKKELDTYFCKSCSITISNTGRQLTREQKRTISVAVRKAYEDGKLEGFKKIHTFYETVFDKQTEKRDYWWLVSINQPLSGIVYFKSNSIYIIWLVD
jgi:hypothetical protein